MPLFTGIWYPQPERRLRVLAAFGGWLKSITFASCRSCSVHVLRAKLEKAFSLHSRFYAIAFTDDDGEASFIDADDDLVEVLRYLDDSAGDSQSVKSGFSNNSAGFLPSIVLKVQIFVDYDGHLSDVGSNASFDAETTHCAAADFPDCMTLDGPPTPASPRSTFSGDMELDMQQSAGIDVFGDTRAPEVQHALTHTHISQAWLQDQRRLACEANVGRTPPPSDYQISLHTGSRGSSAFSRRSSFTTSHGERHALLLSRARLPQSARPRRSRSAVFLRDLDARLPAILEAPSDGELRAAAAKPDLMFATPALRPADDNHAPLASLTSSTVYLTTLATPHHESTEHVIYCSHCLQPAQGVHFQCATCPSNPEIYNLCAACEQSSHMVHDPMHIFLKLRRPASEALTSREPLVPQLYEAASADFAMGGRNLGGWVHCDECGGCKPLRGEWYWCLQCGRDLCAVHEAVDTHDDTHVFVLFKSGVDIDAFSQFARSQLGITVPLRRRVLARVLVSRQNPGFGS